MCKPYNWSRGHHMILFYFELFVRRHLSQVYHKGVALNLQATSGLLDKYKKEQALFMLFLLEYKWMTLLHILENLQKREG